MAGRRRTERELHWRGVLQRHDESGVSVAVFCRNESISAPSFYAWRRKLKERDARAQSNASQNEEAHPEAQLVPVRIEAGTLAAPVRILLPQGVSLDVPISMDRRALVELLGALRESQLC